jgi:flagellar motor switch protein FliM
MKDKNEKCGKIIKKHPLFAIRVKKTKKQKIIKIMKKIEKTKAQLSLLIY